MDAIRLNGIKMEIQNTCMHEIFNTSKVTKLLNSLLQPPKYLFIFARGIEIFESQTSNPDQFYMYFGDWPLNPT